MASYKTLFQEKKNQNWLKASVAVYITRKGLIPFVTTVVTVLHQAIRANVEQTNYLPPGVTCNSCSTPNVLPCRTRGVCGMLRNLPCRFHQHANFRNCPAKICNGFMLGIEGHHRFKGPSWKNTNANDWCSNPWEVAKCFLPPDGYLNVRTADDTDINGIISLIINCKLFDNYFTDDLSQLHNICTKVRDVGRKLRHSPKIMVSDADLSNCIDALKTLLQDSKFLASNTTAKDALANLTLLENDQLIVSTDDLANVVSNAISTTSELLKSEKHLQDKMDELRVLEQHIQTLGDEVVQRIENARKEDNLERYRSKSTALKQNLQKYYLESCSALDLGPMFDIDSPNLVDVYMPPQLSKSTVIKCPSSIGVKSKIDRSNIKEFDKVFRNMGEQAKHIYITAKAGVGKSAFCKFIVRLWCAFQTNNTEDIESLKSRGAGTYLNICKELKNVQYVFYACLNQSRSRQCEMDDIVFHQVIRRLSKSEDYDMKFLQEILDKERCLMIFDGLDEWSHPDVEKYLCVQKDTESPHARSRENCTVMITSRHWKLGLQKMHSKKSNICVEIEEMNDTNIRSLVKQAFTLLVGDSEPLKEIEEFFRFIERKGLQNLIHNTLVALQLLSLWYEGHSLGNTKCQVYCNVLEMMFANVLQRNPHKQYYVAEDHQRSATIRCLQTRRHCLKFQEYIRNLGKMAFYSLFDVETLEAQIASNLSKSIDIHNAEELGLLTGLLSKTQLHSSSVVPRYEYSFLHKTYQEMLACVYIASIPYDNEEHERLVETIKSSSQTLSFDMMLFLSGMHGACAQDMFEIYCDLQTNMLCQSRKIEHSDFKRFHENCLSIIDEMKANNIAAETGMKMRSLLLDGTYNDSSIMDTVDNDDISFLVLKTNDLENIDQFYRVQAILKDCKTKLMLIRIEKDYGMDNTITCSITHENIHSWINLHTLALKDLSISGDLDLTGCSSLSALEFSQENERDPVRLIIPPKRLKICSVMMYPFERTVVSIKCTCPFNSELLEALVLVNVNLEDNLRLLDFKQLQKLWLVNVDTKATCIEYSQMKECVLGGVPNPTLMKDALQSLQYSKYLSLFTIWDFNDISIARLNKTLLTLENIEEIGFFFSDCPLIDIHIPMSVRELAFYFVIISAECLMKLINKCKTRHGVHFYLNSCYVPPSDNVTIETIVGKIKQCNHCILDNESIVREDEMKEHYRFDFKINVAKLDFKITSDR